MRQVTVNPVEKHDVKVVNENLYTSAEDLGLP